MPIFTSTTPLLGGAFPFELLLLTIAICTVIALTVFAVGKRRKIPKNLRGKNVLITGGGSGIGRKQAILFAKQGCNVIICDLRMEFLEKVAKEIEEMHQQTAVEGEGKKQKQVAASDASTPSAPEEHYRPRVYTYVCDVSDRHKVYALASKVKAEVGTVDILVNNAGIVIGKPFLELSDEQLMRTMDVNSLAHFWTLRAFLPEMIERDSGHIVTVASIAGLFGAPHLADYSASKFAVVGLHESIRLELRKLKKKGVKMTLVAPSPINTGFFDGFKTSLGIPLLDENHVATAIVEGVLFERQVLVLPQFIEYAYILLRMMPVDWRDTISEMMGTHQCMNSFKGRGIDFAMKKLEQSCAEPALNAESVN